MCLVSLERKPGLGLGPFTFGMPICEAITNIEQDTNNYNVLQLKYYGEEPLMFDILINFLELGFELQFEPYSQQLRLIDVFDVQCIKMSYENYLICGPNTATFAIVYDACGPTYPRSYDTNMRIYALFYQALSFSFPIPPQYEYCVDHQVELTLDFFDRKTLVTSCICIYDKSNGSVGVGASLNKSILPLLLAGSLSMEEVHANLVNEIWFNVGGQHLPFGASP